MPNNLMSTLNEHLYKQSTPEKKEFGNASLQFIRKRMFWRFKSQEKRTQDVNDFINGLSDKAFSDNIDMVLLQVNTDKKECSQYTSGLSQTNAVIKRLPRLGNYKTRTLEYINKQRRKYGL
jgi:hypothetical protein